MQLVPVADDATFEREMEETKKLGTHVVVRAEDISRDSTLFSSLAELRCFFPELVPLSILSSREYSAGLKAYNPTTLESWYMVLAVEANLFEIEILIRERDQNKAIAIIRDMATILGFI